MPLTYIRRAAVALALLAAAGCTVKNTEQPPLSGPSGLALTLTVNAIPDSISQDGGSQSAVKVLAIGPNGKPVSGLPLRLDMLINGVAQDYGTLSARAVVTNGDGVATAVYTAPPGPANGVFGTCNGLPGNCVSIIATAIATDFTTANPQTVTIRLVPTGVILPPASSPTASFTVSPTPATEDVPLRFDGSASTIGAGATQITNYDWDFGDGQTGTGKTTTHTYGSDGTYTVKLTVTNDRGLSAFASQQLTVTAVTPLPAAKPTAAFTFSPAAPGVNETVFFNASTSVAGTGHTIASYAWTFGDGATGSGVTVSHAFATAGAYIVQLTVTDEAGQAVTSSGTTITVGSPPSPSSNFTFSPSFPVVNDSIVFDASTSTTPQGATITKLAWNFGDSTPVTSCPGDANCNGTRIISHKYTLAGTYIVNLVVTDSAGRTAAHSQAVAVGTGNPEPVITVSPGTGTTATVFNFSSSGTRFYSGATGTTFAWTFGDGGSVANNQSPTHTYAAAGTYTVRLTVTDSQGRVGSTTVTVTVS